MRGKTLAARVVALPFHPHAYIAADRKEPFMSQIRFTKDHEYVRVEGDNGVVGISDHAQSQLGDVVFVELPQVGKKLKAGDPAAVVESVKAASDVFSPVSGEVVAVNARGRATPALINEDALGARLVL